MKLWCLLIVFLIVNFSASLVYSLDLHANSKSSEDLNPIPSNFQSASFMKQRRSVVKRSPRNANILYRLCRQSGQAPQFCIKYAVRMVYATGH